MSFRGQQTDVSDVGAAPDLLERSGPLSALRLRLSEVGASRSGKLVLLEGEAGIGKTALLRRFISELDKPVRLLWAACDPVLTPRPLGPLMDFGRGVDGDLAEVLASPRRPYEVVDALLRELSQDEPSVLVFEDVHWADEATLDVVRLLARRIRQVPVLLLLSYRDDELSRTHPWQVVLGELPVSPDVERLRLEPLSLEAVRALAAASGPDPVELRELTAGNPFFVTEVIAAGSRPLPRTIRAAVLARVARLSPPARELLDAVSVLPERAEVWLLEALAPRAVGHLEECLGAGVLISDRSSVAFRHELSRLVVEESLPPDQRVALHRAALAALRHPVSGTIDFSRLSYHADAAGDVGAVRNFAPISAALAAAAGARREAREQYARALRFANQVPLAERAHLLECFAEQAYLTGRLDEAVAALEEALAAHEESGDLHRQAEALRQLAKALGALARLGEARTAAERAVAILEQQPPGPGLARAYSTLSAVRGVSDPAEGFRLGLIASSLAEQVGDTETLIAVLNIIGALELRQGLPDGLDKLERSRQLAEAAGDEVAAGRAYLHTAWLLVRQRDCLAEHYLRAAIDYCGQHGLDGSLGWLNALDADLALARGRWTDAETKANAVLEVGSGAHPQSTCTALLVLARLRARRGPDGSWSLIDEAGDLAKSLGLAPLSTAVAVAGAEVAWLEDRPAELKRQTDILVELPFQSEPWFAYELACWRRRAGQPGPGLADMPEPYRSQVDGDSHNAAKWWLNHGCPYDAALALYDTGEPAALRRSLEEMRRLGARRAASIVTKRLREVGERQLPRGPRPATAANPAGLTDREVAVLALLAAGLANRDIANRLVVSLRTVENHVAAIFRKLGAHDRAGARAAAARLGGRASGK